MAVQLSLTRISTGEDVSLIKLDEELCNYLRVPCHPDKWVNNWMNEIGFGLALGRGVNDLIDEYADDPTMVNILGYIGATFYNTSYRC